MDFSFPEHDYEAKNDNNWMSTMITFINFSMFENVYLNSNEYNVPFIRNNFSLRLYNRFLQGSYVPEKKENFMHI